MRRSGSRSAREPRLVAGRRGVASCKPLLSATWWQLRWHTHRAYARAMRVSLVLLATLAAAIPTFANAQQPIPLDRFRACLSIDDMTKERLDCFDAITPPQPRQVTAKPAAIAECRYYREEDERLRCYNGFLVARVPSATRQASPPAAQQIPLDRLRPCQAIPEMTKERLDCFDAVMPPAPRTFTAAPRSILECRFYREQDDRLRCYLNFAAKLFPNVVRRAPQPAPAVQSPNAPQKHVGRGGCGSRGGAGHRTRSGKCASRKR
jgi:hypothetical protein